MLWICLLHSDALVDVGRLRFFSLSESVHKTFDGLQYGDHDHDNNCDVHNVHIFMACHFTGICPDVNSVTYRHILDPKQGTCGNQTYASVTHVLMEWVKLPRVAQFIPIHDVHLQNHNIIILVVVIKIRVRSKNQYSLSCLLFYENSGFPALSSIILPFFRWYENIICQHSNG